MVRIFKGTCEAVRALHDYHTLSGSQSQPSAPSTSHVHQPNDHDDEEGDELLSHPESNGDASVSVPLVKKRRVDVEDNVFDDDEEVSKLPNGNSEPGKGEHVPYAHRDIKPG